MWNNVHGLIFIVWAVTIHGYSYNKYDENSAPPLPDDEALARITVPPFYGQEDDSESYNYHPAPSFVGVTPHSNDDHTVKPAYSFSYGVDDHDTGNSQARYESRDGDVVHGEYSLVDPDGYLRKVYYTSDPRNGFRATVEYIPPAESSNNHYTFDHDRITFPSSPQFPAIDDKVISFDHDRIPSIGSFPHHDDDYVAPPQLENLQNIPQPDDYYGAPPPPTDHPEEVQSYNQQYPSSHESDDYQHTEEVEDYSHTTDPSSAVIVDENNVDRTSSNIASYDSPSYDAGYQVSEMEEILPPAATDRLEEPTIGAARSALAIPPEQHNRVAAAARKKPPEWTRPNSNVAPPTKKPPILKYYRRRVNVESSTAHEDNEPDFPPLLTDVIDAPEIDIDDETTSHITDDDDVDDEERK